MVLGNEKLSFHVVVNSSNIRFFKIYNIQQFILVLFLQLPAEGKKPLSILCPLKLFNVILYSFLPYSRILDPKEPYVKNVLILFSPCFL